MEFKFLSGEKENAEDREERKNYRRKDTPSDENSNDSETDAQDHEEDIPVSTIEILKKTFEFDIQKVSLFRISLGLQQCQSRGDER